VIGGDSAPRIQNVEYASAVPTAAEEILLQSSPDERKHTMTVTQTLQTSSPQSNQKSGAALMAKHWGPERLVEVTKEPNCSLGISIVGGKVSRICTHTINFLILIWGMKAA